MNTDQKSGSGLVIAMIMLLLISVLTVGLFSLVNFNGLQAVYTDQTEEAFWAAEEGLGRIVQKVSWDDLFRSSPYSLESPTNILGVSYAATVVDVTDDKLSKIYTLRSSGYAPRAERTVEVKIRVTPGAVGYDFGEGGDFGTQNNIYAPVIIRPGGELDTGNNSSSAIHGFIIGDADRISGSGDYQGQVGLPPDYIPPSIDDSAYQTIIAGAGPADGSSPTYVTNGQGWVTITYHTDPAMAAGELPIPDGHTLIAPGTIDFGNNHVDVGENVEIYAGGDVLFPGHSTIGSGTLIFADQNIEFGTHGSSDNTETTGVVLLSENGDIHFDSQAYFDGLIFSEKGTVYLGASAEINGAIIAGEGISKNETGNAPVSGLTATYDPGLFDLDLLDSVELNWNGQVISRKVVGSWKEL